MVRKYRRRRRRQMTASLFWIPILILLLAWLLGQMNQPENSYERLLGMLEEEPADITAMPYEENIPEEVRNRINEMMASGEEKIVYVGEDAMSSICIYRYGNSDSDWDIKVVNAETYASYSEVVECISMYRNGDDIVIYGSTFPGIRQVLRYAVDAKTGEVDVQSPELEYVDLYGVDAENITVASHSDEATLVQCGDEFVLYRLGNQLGEAEKFPGGEILARNAVGYLDDNGDLYYLYYSGIAVNPWVKFVKVDDGVTGIEDSYSGPKVCVEGTDCMVRFPVYYKGEDAYAAVLPANTQRLYGKDYACCSESVAVEEVDFAHRVIELSDENVEYVIVELKDEDWYLRYVYSDDGEMVYQLSRIAGLDSNLSGYLSQDEVERFDNLQTTMDGLNEVVADLKAVYEKYE